MATIVRTREGSWRVQVRRKGKYASQTFRLKSLANEWAIETVRLIDPGGDPGSWRIRDPKTLADLMDLHVADLHDVGRPLRRSKQAVMDAMKRDLGATWIKRLDRAAIIKYGQRRAKQGVGPVTLAVDQSHLRTVLTHAAAIHGISVDTESVASLVQR